MCRRSMSVAAIAFSALTMLCVLGSMSAGQKRRIALARLLLSPATLWILDEPFTAIDLAGVAELESLIAAHAAAGGAVLLTTHHRLAIANGLRRLTLGQQMVD